MGDKFFEPLNCVRYLGVYLDQNLSFQEEVKHILRNLACGIKTIYSACFNRTKYESSSDLKFNTEFFQYVYFWISKL